MYKITEYSKKQAKKLGVTIEPSENKNKKIDVYKDNKKIASIGDIRFLDYPNFLKKDKALAEQKRSAYKARHEKYRNIKGTNSYFADKILW